MGLRHGSAQLEARGALDGVQELAPQQRLVLELGELQQVHAGAGCGQPLQVGAPVVDAERGVQLLQDSGRMARSPSTACREPFRLTQEVTAVLTCPQGDTRFFTALKLGSSFYPIV